MRSVISDRFFSWSQRFEGYVAWMYLDVKGLVTTGVGNLIDPVGAALVLPWKRADGSLATQGEIASEWRTIKTHTELAKLGHVVAKRYCKLHLEHDDVEKLVQQKLAANWDWMRKHYFPACDEWPATAQLATSSMAWALGAGFPVTFKNYAAAAKKRDWAGCAAACKISTKNNAGVAPRNEANKALLLKAATQTPEQFDEL